MTVLALESSCDETAVALYDDAAGLRAHRLHSQVALHAEYGGVVPELASRDHIRRVVPLARQVLAERAKAVVMAIGIEPSNWPHYPLGNGGVEVRFQFSREEDQINARLALA